MPHIHTKDNQHDLTVTAYVVRVDTAEPRVLLHMHRKLGVLLPVGGHVELLETPWQAAIHELAEESGYTIDQLQILQPKSRIKQVAGLDQHPYPILINTHPIPPMHFHTDIDYAFVATSDSSRDVAIGESSDIRWLNRDELDGLPESATMRGVREVYRFILDEALQGWDRVAGDAWA